MTIASLNQPDLVFFDCRDADWHTLHLSLPRLWVNNLLGFENCTTQLQPQYRCEWS